MRHPRRSPTPLPQSPRQGLSDSNTNHTHIYAHTHTLTHTHTHARACLHTHTHTHTGGLLLCLCMFLLRHTHTYTHAHTHTHTQTHTHARANTHLHAARTTLGGCNEIAARQWWWETGHHPARKGIHGLIKNGLFFTRELPYILNLSCKRIRSVSPYNRSL